MRSILAILREFCWNQFKRIYLNNQKHFLVILLRFWNLHNILIILEKKMSLIA